jgi:hypothetical protein
MAATRGKVRGYQRHGGPQNTPVTRLGHGHVEAEAATWRTFAWATVYADGHGSVEVKRDGKLLHIFTFSAER